MNSLFEKLSGMSPMTDQVIATDMLIAAKTGVKTYALAITETASPVIRAVLSKQLEEEIKFHYELTNYMIDSGYYYPHNTSAQFKTDQKMMDAALEIGYKQDQTH
ncbi:spore coat protein [Jeotgalibacillus proteolyticus]|uniref:spore coat protein n=1 Tax=Jeotgalibacillus proteolyticus TaxID=2082395 RepID=UPI003CF976DA